MNIKGEHIYLRALEPADLDKLYGWENNPAIWKVSNTLMPFSKFVLEQYLVNAHEDIFTAKQVRLMICTHAGEAVGTIELFEYDPLHARAGIGIMIEESSRNRGYANSALQLLCGYCFGTLMLKQIYCNISSDNTLSLSIFKKLGFVEIGVKKHWNKTGPDTWEDEWMLYKPNDRV